MLTDSEKNLLASLNHRQIYSDTEKIASYDRRSGCEGEKKSIEFLIDRLDSLKVRYKLHHYPVWLSDPVSARLVIKSEGSSPQNIPCKTWSFCGSTQAPVQGKIVFLESANLERNPLNLLAGRMLKRKKDLDEKIVLMRGASPVSIMDVEDRGAKGVICVWEHGNERLIHEGNVNLVWGQPDPLESSFYVTIPVLQLSSPVGEELIAMARRNSMDAVLEAFVENTCKKIPVLEADIPGESENYVLLGNHLDSWHLGACDNATGNAIALNMAALFASSKLKRSLKICWWSGHSNGRYAGSEAFASRNYASLQKNCLALCNSDMPGLEGAHDFARCSSGPDLRDLYASVISDITGQKLRFGGFVTGWDLSFKNIGISSCMSWTSTIPDGAPQSTNNSFMSWWWHTEEDLMEHIEQDVLKKDAEIYALTLNRLLAPIEFPFNNEKIREQLLRQLERFDDTDELREKLKKVHLSKTLHNTRVLNRALYTFKGSSQQDWAIGLDYLPGLSLVKNAKNSRAHTLREQLLLESFYRSQMNRLYELFSSLE